MKFCAPDERIPARLARNWGDLIVQQLTPLCERVELAGSLRRGKELVGDIDLVLLPRPCHAEACRMRIKQATTVEKDGQQNLIVRLSNGVQVDVFFARQPETDLLGNETPGNFGSLLLCRTGSKEHNIFVAERAKRRGWHWDPYQGLFNEAQKLVATGEREILEALDLGWIEPSRRER